MEQEIWKIISGMNNKYSISNLGNIKSNYWNNNGNIYNIEKPISKHLVNDLYYRVRLYKDGTSKNYLIYRLVAKEFLGLDINDTKTLVCHKDDNTVNNNINNLFLGTHLENNRDRMKKGRNGDIKGEKNKQSKLKKEEVIEIKELIKKGIIQEDIAKMFNVSRGAISNISCGRNWKNIIA